VLEAKSGEAGLELIRTAEEKIDLLITDVVMPQMDGPALIREVREIHPDMKVIFISGYTRTRSASVSTRQRDSFPAQAVQPETARQQGQRGDQRRGGLTESRYTMRSFTSIIRSLTPFGRAGDAAGAGEQEGYANAKHAIEQRDIEIFKIHSETTFGDRQSLLTIQNIVRDRVPRYTYLEVGSHLGGTLYPHLTDRDAGLLTRLTCGRYRSLTSVA